jgi:hypothetical protein
VIGAIAGESARACVRFGSHPTPALVAMIGDEPGLDPGDGERATTDADLAQILQQLTRHAGGQIDQAELVVDVDAADVLGIQAGFIGNGADDVARLDAVTMTDGDAEALHALVWRRRRAALLARLIVVSLASARAATTLWAILESLATCTACGTLRSLGTGWRGE